MRYPYEPASVLSALFCVLILYVPSFLCELQEEREAAETIHHPSSSAVDNFGGDPADSSMSGGVYFASHAHTGYIPVCDIYIVRKYQQWAR